MFERLRVTRDPRIYLFHSMMGIHVIERDEKLASSPEDVRRPSYEVDGTLLSGDPLIEAGIAEWEVQDDV